MRLRPASKGDLPDIASLWNHAIRETVETFNRLEKSPAELAALLDEKEAAGHAFLVVEAGGFAGFGHYGQFRGGVGYAHTMEHTLYLAPAARGRGLGRALLTALEDHARARAVHSLLGGIAGENAPSVAFHARMGYREVATLPQVGFKFGRWMDLVLMQKILS
ncbi:MAG: N-acetyltransferase family protein [Pseudomonadota bacterium]